MYSDKYSIMLDGCWVSHHVQGNGYGRITHDGKRRLAHRVMYELTWGQVKPGLDLDHLCRAKSCCNPWHLEPVTHQDNVLRGTSPAARAVRTGLCCRGHQNWYVRKDGGRICRDCKNERRRRG